MTNYEFIKMLEKADQVKTLYVMGAFGAPAWDKNKERWIKNHKYNQKTARKNKINAASADTFMFDCCGLVKGVINGWCADTTKSYGGMTYTEYNEDYSVEDYNGRIPDCEIRLMLHEFCDNVSTDFSGIVPGSFVVTSDYGHCGVYIGDGIVIESTPVWDDGVQKTICKNVIPSATGRCRTWKRWGTFKMIDYIKDEEENDIMKCPCCGKEIKVSLTEVVSEAPSAPVAPVKKTNEELAKEVIRGLWGNGAARKEALTKAGYDYAAVQKIVNELCK